MLTALLVGNSRRSDKLCRPSELSIVPNKKWVPVFVIKVERKVLVTVTPVASKFEFYKLREVVGVKFQKVGESRHLLGRRTLK